MTVRKLKLGLDIDGCIDEAPDFFSQLSHSWAGPVVVVSFRNNYEKAAEVLAKWNIKYDKLILTSSLAGKASVIEQEQIDLFFDDQPEALKQIPEQVGVFLVRNGGNFDFEDQRWMLSQETGKLL